MPANESANQTMSSATGAVIEDLLVHSAMDALGASAEAFEDSGAVTTPDLDAPKALLLANIGFAGEQLCGCLFVLTTSSVVRAIQPEDVRAYATTDEAIRDLLGELANLILGRLKTQLIKRGVVVLLATPTTVSGRDLQISAAAPSNWHALSCSSGMIFVRLDADFSGCGALADESSSSEAEPPMEHGEMMLFF